MRAGFPNIPAAVCKLGLLFGSLGLMVGCGGIPTHPPTTVAATSSVLKGKLLGGQFPITGSSVQLYAAGSTANGSGATALLSPAVLTDANGDFSFDTSSYSCPANNPETYLIATGGNPGVGGGANPAISLMAALGPCESVSSLPYAIVNEVTTVASVWAIAPFMAYGGQVGTDTTDAPYLTSAFTNVNALVDITQGLSPGPSVPNGVTVPVAEIDTIANILASCVNSTGTTACNALFAAVTPLGGASPTNTLDAALDMAFNPDNNVSALFALPTPDTPFGPSLSTAPANWLLGNSISSTAGGTAALGDPIASAPVTLVDANGTMVTGTTGSDGTYLLNSAGLTPPFLVKVVTVAASGAYPAGTTLYSVSADGIPTTHINVSLLTDLIVRSWYSAQGIDVDSAFTSPVSNPAPKPLAVGIVSQTVLDAMQFWFSKAGLAVTASVPPYGSINPILSSFAANNTGLDGVLGKITSETLNSNTGAPTAVTVAGGAVTETITPVYTGGAIAFNTITTDSSSGAATTGSVSTVAPTATVRTTIDQIYAQLTAFANAVNAHGSALSGSDLLPFFNSDYLNDGDNSGTDSAQYASNLAGLKIGSIEISDIKSLNTTTNTADLILVQTEFSGSVTATSLTEQIFKDEGSGWLLYGDQRIADVAADAQSRSAQGAPSLGSGVSHGTYIFAEVEAPHGVVTAASVSGAGDIWSGTASGTLTEGSEILTGGQAYDDFYLLSQSLGTNISQLPAPGTAFNFALTTASSGNPQYAVPSNAFTTEVLQFSGISNTAGSGPLSSVVDKTLTYNWSLPTTYAIDKVDLFAYVYDGPANNAATHSCEVELGGLGVTATSGTITIPANMSACGLSASDAIQQVNVFLEVTGTNGEDSLDALVYPY